MGIVTSSVIVMAQEGSIISKRSIDDSGSFVQNETNELKRKLQKQRSKELSMQMNTINNNFIGSFINDKAKKNRSHTNFKGETVNLEYKGTQNFKAKRPEDRIDAFGTYDEYVDDEETLYYFLYGTDKLCFKFSKNKFAYYSNEGKIPSENDYNAMRVVADEYISKELGEESQEYIFDNISYNGQKSRYLALYYRKLGKYKVDDVLAVFIDDSGEVYTFSAMNRNRYKSFKVADIKQASLNKALDCVKSGDWKDFIIALDEESGKLIAMEN